MSTTMVINLKRASKVYHEGETVAGVVVVESSGEARHEGLSLVLDGSVSLQLSAKATGILEAFSSNVKFQSLPIKRMISNLPTLMYENMKLPSLPPLFRKKSKEDADSPINLINTTVELAPAGKIPPGVTEIPFEVPLIARGATSPGYPGLLETYHGVFVNVMYTLKASMKRSLFNKPVNAGCQFFVQYKHREAAPLKPVRCEITPASIRAGAASHAHMPSFHIYAEIDSTVCALDKPITGMIRVEECSVGIKSIELQLVRVETCGCADGYSRDATEIQNIQAACALGADVPRGAALPLYMVLPRLFTCPTTATHHFKIEFELNIAVIFEDDYLVTENFPILLLRSR